MTDLAGHTHLHKRLQNPIDGGARQTRNARADYFVDLVGSGMSTLLDQGFENLPPLDSYGEALLTAQSCKLRELVLFGLHPRFEKLS